MALDQGTTGSRAIIFNHNGTIISTASKEFKQIYPQPGWVEHNPREIWSSQIEVAKTALYKAGLEAEDIAAIGITNQRETTIVWDKKTGKPVYNAIVWQCRRTALICDQLKKKGLAEIIQKKTGLVVDAYFSGTKIKWILDNAGGAREKAEKGEVLFGTVDSWLIWNLTKGKTHVTDYSNASRTMLFNIHNLDWDEEILTELDIPREMLPKVLPSSYIYGSTDKEIFRAEIPISGDAGDQQAALFGQACYEPGMAKNTYGTGCFILMNTGEKIVPSRKGLLTTIAWGVNGKVEYALEGSIFIGGAVVQWLRDEIGLIKNSKEIEKYATKEQAQKICKILAEKKEKPKQVKREFKLSSEQPNGMKIIKQILNECKGNCEITYIAAGKYSIKQTSENYKQAEKELSDILEKIREQAKSAKADFDVIEKKK